MSVQQEPEDEAETARWEAQKKKKVTAHRVIREVRYDGSCPRCGREMGSPDDEWMKRCCWVCDLIVEPAIEEWTVG